MRTPEEILVENDVFKEPNIGSFNLIIHRDAYVLAQRNIKRALIQHTRESLDALYEEVKYGDDEHQKWLKDKIEEFKNKIN